MSEFILLYRFTLEAQEAALGSPERAAQSLRKWTTWLDAIRQSGQLKDAGLPLLPAGRTVRKAGVVDGPYAETKELVGGFSIVEARDLDEAARLAEGCPILERG